MSKWARLSAFTAATLLLASSASRGQSAPDKAGESDKFFRSGSIPELVIELDDDACEALRADARKYVMGKLREKPRTEYEEVSFKLKGAAGSFREFDDLPSFTVRMDRGDQDQRFHGLRKFHLNKSPQDETYLQELLGSDIFNAAGILTPRVTHARVWINQRDMGLYVVKEGFDPLFIKRGFSDSSGNLYDGGFCQDVDAELEKDEGSGPDDRSDLRNLLEISTEPDLVRRWERLTEVVDVESFLTFMAIEQMLGHWDGYCLNRNNYRLYFDPSTRKAYFLPHGMDQLFQDAEASVLDNPPALVAIAIMQNPAWRAAYRKRISDLLPLFDADKLKKRVEQVTKRLQPVLEDFDKDVANAQKAAANELKSRLEARERSLKEQQGQEDPKPLVFRSGRPEPLLKWRPNSECEDASLTQEKDSGVQVMTIAAGKSGRCIASWRKGVLLQRGKYRFRAIMRIKDVVTLADDRRAPGVGAGLRLANGTREAALVGSTTFKTIDFEFEITEEAADVELVIELRASGGSLAIKTDSLTLTKLES